MNISKNTLFDLANTFRTAIVKAKNNKEFDNRDRMSQFPRGCCDDTADLFAHYLYHNYNIPSYRVDGAYYDDNAENNSNHSWQEINGLVIDLTGSQFRNNPTFLNYDKEVYVGCKDRFHKLFLEENRFLSRGIESLSDNCHDRMNDLYDKIIRYIE